MKLIKSKKGIALLGVLVVAAVAAFGAYAYFTSTGQGTGTATTGSATQFSVHQDAYTTDTPAGSVVPVPLFPGNGVQQLSGTVKNVGSGNQQLAQVKVTITAPSNTGSIVGDPACTAADYALTTAGGSGWTIAADGLSATKAYVNDLAPNAVQAFSGINLTMLDRQDAVGPPAVNGNQDNCQGATAHLQYDAS